MSVEQQPLFETAPPVAPTPEMPKQGVLPDPPAAPAEPTPEVAPMPPRDEAERLDPQPLKYVLASGTQIELEALKLRQFLRLLRIVTRGAAESLDAAKLDFEDPQAFMQTFVGLVLFSIPEAEEETIDFLKSMVLPKGLTGDPKTDILKIDALHNELDNPELDDVVTIVELIIRREAEDIRALGKRLGAMLKVAEKMGATSPSAPTPAI